MSIKNNLAQFYSVSREISCYEEILSLLYWDQKTYLPLKGAHSRAKQMAAMEKLIHHLKSEDSLLTLLENLGQHQDELNETDRINVTKTLFDVRRLRKLPENFINERAELHALSYSEWVKARPQNDFKTLAPLLERIITMARKECDLIGDYDHPYDVLLHNYEPFSTLASIKPLLLDLAAGLKKLITEMQKKPRPKEISGVFPIKAQQLLCARVAGDLGYSFESGRLDSTTHPFACGIGEGDVRITTRYHEHDLLSAMFSTMHEAGHALYDLGLRPEYRGTPCGSARSLGMHESQSRFWENFIGRSRPFSLYLHNLIGEFFPDTVQQFSANDIFDYINYVEPSLIRVEADEVTYSLHIVIRMLLEERLIEGTLVVKDLPEAWNELYREYLGIYSPDLKDGVLQDVHWFSGGIGYFPTYAFGNIYAAMMNETIKSAVREIDQKIESGDFSEILDWLRTNVHCHGTRGTAAELVKIATGENVTIKPFLDYLSEKHKNKP